MFKEPKIVQHTQAPKTSHFNCEFIAISNSHMIYVLSYLKTKHMQTNLRVQTCG